MFLAAILCLLQLLRTVSGIVMDGDQLPIFNKLSTDHYPSDIADRFQDPSGAFPDGTPDVPDGVIPSFGVKTVSFFDNAGCLEQNSHPFTIGDWHTTRNPIFFCSSGKTLTTGALGVRLDGNIGNCQLHFYGDTEQCGVEPERATDPGSVIAQGEGECEKAYWVGYMTFAEQAYDCMNPMDFSGKAIQNIKAFGIACPNADEDAEDDDN